MKSEIDDIIKRLNKVADLVNSKNGQTIDLAKERIFTKGIFLHQDTESMSEEESAEFERENTELFNFLRAFDDQIRDIF